MHGINTIDWRNFEGTVTLYRSKRSTITTASDRDARVPVNRKAGARGSADRRAALAAAAAAELHKDDKENDTSALTERSSSEKNLMNSQHSSGGSAERHRDPEQGAGLSCGVDGGVGSSEGGQIKAGGSKSAPSPPRSAIDQQWCVRREGEYRFWLGLNKTLRYRL